LLDDDDITEAPADHWLSAAGAGEFGVEAAVMGRSAAARTRSSWRRAKNACVCGRSIARRGVGKRGGGCPVICRGRG
jgi:hypothetical protein